MEWIRGGVNPFMISLKLAKKGIENVMKSQDFKMLWQVTFYSDLMRIIKSDKKITVVTRDAYERYYGMRQARLSDTWLNKYFDTANKYLCASENDKKNLTLEVLMTEVGSDGNSVQFSFVSKLFHTIKNDEPIYDRYVREFLGVKSPHGKNADDRKASAIEIYSVDIKSGFYENDDYRKLRILMLEVFSEKCVNAENISDIKKIDFVLWALGRQGKKITDFIR